MSGVRRPSFGALLASGDAVGRAISSCSGALDSGVDVFLYLLHDGTRQVHEPALQALRDRGVRLFCCAFGARRRGMEADEAAVYCGLGTLADIIASVDRFTGYTGSPWDGGASGGPHGGEGENRRVLVNVCSNPEADDRAAEGVRVAAGLRASGRLNVGLVFWGAARRCLESGGEAMVDGRDMVMNLRSFRESGGDVGLVEVGPGVSAGSTANAEGCFTVLGF